MSRWFDAVDRRRLLLLAGGSVGLSATGPPAFAGDPGDAGSERAGGGNDGDGRWSTSDGDRPRQADYERLRLQWRAMIVGRDVDPEDERFTAAIGRIDDTVAEYLAKVDRGSERGRVFVDLELTDDAAIWKTYERLRMFAIGWATPGGASHEDADLLADILAGLRLAYERAYNENETEFGNWWHWEIGVPRNLTDALTLVYAGVEQADLDSYLATIDHFVPDPFYMMQGERRQESTGANRVDLCRAVCVRGILGADDDRIGRSRDGLSDIFAYVTTGDGFYRDGSFVQHGTVPYTGTYGTVLLDGMSRLIALLVDSPWVVDDPDREVLFRAVEITFAPVVYDNQMLDSVRGRAVSRVHRQDHHNGRAAAEHILRLADGIETEDAERAATWRGLSKGWLTRDVFPGPYDGASVPRVAAFARVLDDDAVPATPEPRGFTVFPEMDRVVHRSDGWAYAIAMSSSRISYYEHGNGENETGFHTGEGMTYLYLATDNSQFMDGFWPTVDPYRMPGTTVDTARLPRGAGGAWGKAKPEQTTWVGGARLAGRGREGNENQAHAGHPRDAERAVGAVGMDMEGIQAPLTGRKSWFCLPDGVLALGAGITDTNGVAVETVVENRNLHADGNPALLLDGREQGGLGDDAAFAGSVRWAHLEGVAGYVFAPGTRLRVRREERTGSWRDVNDGGPRDPITRRWLTMWLDHGVDPTDAGYAYMVLPGAEVDHTARMSRWLDVRILANTARVQAIRVRSAGLTAVNFWRPGALAGVEVDAPCSLLLRREGPRRLALAVSDPTHLASQVRVSVRRGGFRDWEVDDTITVRSVHPRIDLLVDTAGSAGASHAATFLR